MTTECMTAAEYRALIEKQEAKAGNKYHAQPEYVDDIYFPSRKEANRYCELKLAQRGGLISDLRVHVRIQIAACKCVYVADSVYVNHGLWKDIPHGKMIIEDTKGNGTKLPLFWAKWHAGIAQYPDWEWRIYE